MRGTRAARHSLLVALLLLAGLTATLAPRADAYIYWARGAGGGVGRANVDGSDVRPQVIPGPGSGADCGVAIDSAHIYWVNRLTQTGQSVGRANLDGSGVNQNFIPTARSMPCGVAVDQQHVYWANTFSKAIGRADIDGTNADQSFIPNQFLPCQVAVDSDHVYWSPGIMRANLDGTGVQSVVPGASSCGVAIDDSHIYWIKPGSHQGDPASILRSKLDGTGAQVIVGNAGAPCGLAVDDKYLYWMDQNFNQIDRANLDGHGIPQVPFIRTGAVRQACGVAIDRAGPGAQGIKLGKPERNKRKGTARVEARVSFTPTNGTSTTRSWKIKLVRR